MKNKISIFEQAYYDYIFECDGGCAGGDCGGAAVGDAPAAPCGDGSAIATGDVLGHCDHSTPGKGYMGDGCFHMPFPAMPIVARYGWSSNVRKGKKGKKIKTKNPYAVGMKILKDSAAPTEKAQTVYSGSALVGFKALTNDKSAIYTDVLYLNQPMKMAWRVGSDGLLYIYKALSSTKDSTKTVIRCMKLDPSDKWLDVAEYGDFADRDEGYDVIKSTCAIHREKLNEVELNQVTDGLQPAIKSLRDLCDANRTLVKFPEIDGSTIYVDFRTNDDLSSDSRLDEIIKKVDSLFDEHGISHTTEYEFHPYGQDDEAFKLNSLVIEIE